MGSLQSLDQFCLPVSPFWRRDSTELTSCQDHVANQTCFDAVDLTQCFEDTAILYGISIIFWLLAGLEFCCYRPGKPRLKLGRLSITKTLLALVVMVTALCDLAYTIHQGTHASTAHYLYLSPCVLAITMILAVLVLQYERSIGLRSSAMLFLLWLALLVYACLKLRTLISIARDTGGVDDAFRFTTFCLQFTVYLSESLLVLLREPRSPFYYRWGDDEERKPCPEEDATFLSQITWWWLNGLIWHGWRKALEYDDLTDLNQEDKSRVVAPHFQRNWNHELHRAGSITVGQDATVTVEYRPGSVQSSQGFRLDPVSSTEHAGKRRKASFMVPFVKTFWRIFLAAAFFRLLQVLLSFASPQLLKQMIRFTKNKDEPDVMGYVYAILLFLVAELQSFLTHQHMHRNYVMGMRSKSALVAAVYRKFLRLSNAARRRRTAGEIVNLMSIDAERFLDHLVYVHVLWFAPLQIAVAVVFLWYTVGPAVFAGVGVLLLLVPVNVLIAAKSRQYQARQMTFKDSRIKLINEVLNGIKMIKLYAWEIPFQRLIMGIRRKEMSVLKKFGYLYAGSSLTWNFAPFLISLTTFTVYALAYQDDPEQRLTPERVFVALSLFDLLATPLAMFPLAIAYLVECNVSIRRLRDFLKSDELDPESVQWRPQPAMSGEVALSIRDGNFTWGKADRPTLSKVNVEVDAGQLVAAVGQVGAGKSSLIQAFLGEMDKISGTVSVKGRVAYVPQQAWIQNATVKDNILFGKPYDEVAYKRTLSVCALEQDLEILPGGDMTEIGECGMNLQRDVCQRVSLARAVYQDVDVYLLDDPLSAVDSHVGKHIFDKVIGPEGVLNGKVRLLVTNALGFLPQCDKVIALEDGMIAESGSYAELIDSDGAFAEFLQTHTNCFNKAEDDAGPEKESTMVTTMTAKTTGNYPQYNVFERSHSILHSGSVDSKMSSVKDIVEEVTQSHVTKERPEKGMVKLSVYFAYFKACTYRLSLLLILLFMAAQGSYIGSSFWLAHWSNKEAKGSNHSINGSSANLGLFLGGYAALGFTMAVFIFLGAFTLAIVGIVASQSLHRALLKGVMHSPMVFFDTTPLGRILNRFSSDIHLIDVAIPRAVYEFFRNLFKFITALITIVVATPIFLVALVPLGVFYFVIQRIYVANSRQLIRIFAVTRSPVFSHFRETITGAPNIRAYHAQESFIMENQRRVDCNQAAYYPMVCAIRWLGIRIEFVGNLILLFAALFAVIQRNYGEKFNMSVSAGLVGLSISHALKVTHILDMMVHQTSVLETDNVAVERTKEYAELPNEAPSVIEPHPDPDWPAEGNIMFNCYCTVHREGLGLALRDITVSIPGGTKLGIVGRTGAGKSSLTLALFRIIEPASGTILIDGTDISRLGLTDLRLRITIIPQDPVLFSGTLRMNLDPFEAYSDQEVWASIESAHLSEFVSSLPEGLAFNVSEGGENLSVGQRQLVCLARALLRKTKILVLDEATAAVDMETDNFIQKMIRAEFADSTVLTIAHRLNTIMDYDRIMVLDAGRVIELDTPNALLTNKNSSFYCMARDSGLTT